WRIGALVVGVRHPVLVRVGRYPPTTQLNLTVVAAAIAIRGVAVVALLARIPEDITTARGQAVGERAIVLRGHRWRWCQRCPVLLDESHADCHCLGGCVPVRLCTVHRR